GRRGRPARAAGGGARARPFRRPRLASRPGGDVLAHGAARARHAGVRRCDRRPFDPEDGLLDPGARGHRRLRARHAGVHRALETMSNLEVGLAGVIVLLAAMFVRIPIAVSLALVGVGGYAAIDGWSPALAVVAAVPFELASAYSLSVVPLFILMGAVASRA